MVVVLDRLVERWFQALSERQGRRLVPGGPSASSSGFGAAWRLICLLVAFGRFAPFYQLFYALPFASTMRNPAKFSHVVEWALVILFAYGVHGLSRRSLQVARQRPRRGLSAQLRAWWAKAGAFDKNWVRGSAIALAASLVAWLIYSSSRERLVAYLQEVDFEARDGRRHRRFQHPAGGLVCGLAGARPRPGGPAAERLFQRAAGAGGSDSARAAPGGGPGPGQRALGHYLELGAEIRHEPGH